MKIFVPMCFLVLLLAGCDYNSNTTYTDTAAVRRAENDGLVAGAQAGAIGLSAQGEYSKTVAGVTDKMALDDLTRKDRAEDLAKEMEQTRQLRLTILRWFIAFSVVAAFAGLLLFCLTWLVRQVIRLTTYHPMKLPPGADSSRMPTVTVMPLAALAAAFGARIRDLVPVIVVDPVAGTAQPAHELKALSAGNQLVVAKNRVQVLEGDQGVSIVDAFCRAGAQVEKARANEAIKGRDALLGYNSGLHRANLVADTVQRGIDAVGETVTGVTKEALAGFANIIRPRVAVETANTDALVADEEDE